MQHFFVPEIPTDSPFVLDAPELVHQIHKVLRMQAGDSFYLLDGRGQRARVEVLELSKRSVSVKVLEREQQEAAKRRVVLAFGIPKKPATLEWILEKATELGATELQPLVTERAQVQELRKMDRLERILQESAEQSERFHLPLLREPMDFEDFVAQGDHGLLLAGDAREGNAYSVHADAIRGASSITILVGPEGGLSPQELQTVTDAGAILIRLPGHVLRIETAALAFLSLVQFA